MKTEQFRHISAELRKRKESAERLAAAKKKSALAKIPNLNAIEENLNKATLEYTRVSLSNDNERIMQAKKLVDDLRKKRNTLLKQENINESDFLPEYSCKHCSDSGYFLDKRNQYQRCKCFKQMVIDELYSQSNIKQILKSENFDNFDCRLFNDTIDSSEGVSVLENMELIQRLAWNFIDGFGKQFKNFLLYGNPGLGKTFICNCIARDLLDKGHTVMYQTCLEFCKLIEDYRFNKDFTSEKKVMMDMAYEAELFILDDLGTEYPGVIPSTSLFDLINERILLRKPTIISTNLKPDEMTVHYSERFTSRLAGNYDFLKFFGEDLRRKSKWIRSEAIKKKGLTYARENENTKNA